MPRSARKHYNTSFFHVMVQGINREYILNQESEMKKYLELLNKYYEKFNLKIISYCIMNNHVHLLLYSDDINEISGFMQCINTSYAMYYNKKHDRCGFVFRDRYKAEGIYSKKHLISCIQYIHANPVKAGICKTEGQYKYSSYNDYIKKSGFVDDDILKLCFENDDDYKKLITKNYGYKDFIEYVERNSKSDKDKIIKYLKANNINMDNIKTDKEKLKELVIKLYKTYEITQTDLANILEINRLKVNRILKK